jgi:hypothetical protein
MAPLIPQLRMPRLRQQVGLALEGRSIRAIGLDGNRITWTVQAELDADDEIATAVAELLRSTPAFGAWPRASVHLSLPWEHARLKRVGGLPSMGDARLQRRMIRSSGSVLLLGGTRPHTIGGIQSMGEGSAWVTTFDSALLRQVEQGCALAGCNLVSFVPGVVAVGRATPNDTVSWHEDGVAGTISFDNARTPVSLRFGPVGTDAADVAALVAEVEPPVAVPPLASLAQDPWVFARAFGAAAAYSVRDPLCLRGFRSDARRAEIPAWRVGIAGAALVASVGVLAAVPGVASMHVRDQALHSLSLLQEDHALALEIHGEIAGAERLLTAVSDLQRRPPVTILMERIARSLPRGSAIVAVRLDSAGGVITALSPRAADLVAALDEVPGIASPEIIGPVTRDAIATPASNGSSADSPAQALELERVSLRFRHSGLISPVQRALPQTLGVAQ